MSVLENTPKFVKQIIKHTCVCVSMFCMRVCVCVCVWSEKGPTLAALLSNDCN